MQEKKISIAANAAVEHKGYMFEQDILTVKQEVFERLHTKHQRMPFVKACIEEAMPQFGAMVSKIAADLETKEEIVEKFFLSSILHQGKRWNTCNVETIYGCILPMVDYDTEECSRIIEGIIQHPDNNLVDGLFKYDKLLLVVKMSLDAEEMANMDKFEFKWPMVIPPKKVTPWSDGYLIAKDIPNSRNNPPNYGLSAYDLDRNNRVAYSFNDYLIQNWDYKFKVKHPEDKAAIQTAFTAYCRKEEREKVIYETFKEHGIKKFYFAHKPDGRLRTYCVGYQFNEQGTDYDKAKLNFAKKIKVSEEGLKWLKVGIANSINPKIDGKRADKQDFATRIKWVDEHIDELENIALKKSIDKRYPEEFQEQYEAEEPAKAFALIHALRMVEHDEAIGDIIYVDAVNQGLQIQGILANDMKTLEQTSVIGQKRHDQYITYCEEIGLDESHRGLLKDALKVLMYGGSGSARLILGDALYVKFKNNAKKYPVWNLIAQFPRQWKEEWDVLRWSLPDGTRTQVYVKGSKKYQAKVFDYEFESSYETFGPNPDRCCSLGPNIIHSIDGFIAREMASMCMYSKKQKTLVQKYLAGEVQQILTVRNDYQLKRDTELQKILELGDEFNWYSHHILDLLDLSNIGMVSQNILKGLIAELPEEPFNITRIHDSFGCHPNYIPDVMKLYRYCLAHLADSNMLEHINQELDMDLKIPAKDVNLSKKILEGIYALC